ncbi:MAG: hypothetical protein HC802_10000, partial [Caldilineaceae bacterium]|nr:hypothetical protein [Caldilineaceae bacterium]
MIRQIRDLIPDLERAHIVPFNTTDQERELAVRLGIPMYAADPRYFAFGTKSGGRQIFTDEGVSHPLGRENITGFDALVQAVAEMQSQKPTLSGVVVKLNEGVSGMGNAFVELGALPEPGAAEQLDAIANKLRAMRFELDNITFDDYIDKLSSNGAIVEELIQGEQFHSPSVQMRITPLGEVEILSTHDQVLGGPSGQSYLGARFPADPNYATLITREAAKIGARFVR